MSQPQQLTASYASPSTSKTFTTDPLPQSSNNVEQKTAYLSALRSNISTLQGDINTFLTQKMEEDKAAEGNDSKKSAADEREEDFYGEEDPEKDG